jgi:L-amino acid N-acyltransferase YncA
MLAPVKRAVRTGPDFRERHVLADGTSVTLRHIRPSDAAELRRGFERLSPESRRRRFFGAVGQLTDEAVRYLTCVDQRDHVALVAVIEARDGKRDAGLGVARFIRMPDRPTVAEAAVTIADEAQGKGLGHLLMTALAVAARERGVSSFYADVLADNAPMHQLMRDLGAVERARDESIIHYDLPTEGVQAEPPGDVGRLLHAAANVVRAAPRAPQRVVLRARGSEALAFSPGAH